MRRFRAKDGGLLEVLEVDNSGTSPRVRWGWVFEDRPLGQHDVVVV